MFLQKIYIFQNSKSKGDFAYVHEDVDKLHAYNGYDKKYKLAMDIEFR